MVARLRQVLGVLLALMVASAAAGIELPPESASANEIAPGYNRVFFPETKQAVGEPFLSAWLNEFDHEEIGMPVSRATKVNETTTQWFEYARLEVTGKPGEQGYQVTRAPIGKVYAERMGYSRWHQAFRPIEASGTEMRYFYETRHALAHDFLKEYEQPGVDLFLGAPISEEFTLGDATYQFFEYGALTWQPDSGTTMLPLGKLDAIRNGDAVADDIEQPGDIAMGSPEMLLLSDLFEGERWIEIDLSDYDLTAYVGDIELMSTEVVTGPVQAPTPTGEFEIYIKHEMQSLRGIGWNGQPYTAPNTPWVMYFYQDYGIHGSTWRDSYGFGDGQGCVIPPNEAAEYLWKWADYGTRVVVKR